jgi:1-acyl-sn-glycerol-3-phosphate acyltransferase
MNHPSWWDPLIAYAMSRLFPRHRHFGVMDAEALKKYAILRKAGMLGVELDSVRGAAQLLRQGRAILSQPGNALWVTAQGEFADVRRRPLALRAGVGHLAARLRDGWVVPIGMEVTFWNERTPELLTRVGDALPFPNQPTTTKLMLEAIEDRLTRTLDALAIDAQTRDPNRFRTLVAGRTGVGGIYDWWRRAKALVRGQRFDASHGG